MTDIRWKIGGEYHIGTSFPDLGTSPVKNAYWKISKPLNRFEKLATNCNSVDPDAVDPKVHGLYDYAGWGPSTRDREIANLLNARRSKQMDFLDDLEPLIRPTPPQGFHMRDSTNSLHDFMRGFNARKQMDITEELNDLKDIYEKTHDHLANEEEMTLTCLVFQMKEFITAHEARKVNQEKLEALKAKLPKEGEDVSDS